MQHAGRVDDDSVGIGDRLDDRKAEFDAQNEDGLRQCLAGESVGSDHGDAMHCMGGPAGTRVNQVMTTLVAVVEIAFVVARCGQRDVLERQQRDDFALAARIANAWRARIAAPLSTA